MEIMQIFREFFDKFKVPRLRDRKEHYASSIMSDLRDQYWSLIGEKETNPPDYHSKIKMFLGNAIEKGLKDEILNNLHFFGFHLLGTQVAAGLDNPNFNMYYDGLIQAREGSKWGKKYVLEVKTKSGIGADMFMRNFDPGESYMAQMALYLHKANDKGVTDEGIFLFIPLSNNTIGDVASVYCKYNQGIITAYRATTLSGYDKKIDFKFDIKIALGRAAILDAALVARNEPKAEFRYKDELTEEYLKSVSDAQLERAAKGEVVLGDWQCKYSRFKDKALAQDKIEIGYSQKELDLLRSEYRKRHPRTKKF